MKKRFLFFIPLLFLGLVACQKQSPQRVISIIPEPEQINSQAGVFSLQKNLALQFTKGNYEVEKVAAFVEEYFSHAQSINLVKGQKAKHTLSLKLNPDAHSNPEGYTLSITPQAIRIEAPQAKGLMYGVQSLRQLLPLNMEKQFKGKLELPCLTIKDAPRFPYRGMHLDVGRHFFPVSFIKKYIDLLALFKMNTFHWHLTEDQGWRIEIKKYPKLTEVGSKRKETIVAHNNAHQGYDGKEYGGFYTQEEIKNVVRYATERFVTVIPEIELPGHSVAALTAYPNLGCTGGPYELRTRWGISDDVYCAGNEETFLFLEDVLTEVMELFPSRYIHIGGDECPKTKWKECSKCQKRIKQEGLKGEHELQSYFIARVEKFLNDKGRAIIGWDEILEGGLAPNATVMSWRGMNGGIEAAKQGHDVIMTPQSHCYFDHYQADSKTEPLAIGGFSPIQKIYTFNPTPKELNEEEAKHILGGQGNVWTEYMKTPEHVEYMVFPRMIALSEVLWTSQENRNWMGFQERLIRTFPRLDLLNVNYSKAIFQVQPNLSFDSTGHVVKVDFDHDLVDAQIRYTLDGSEPKIDSELYEKPFTIKKSVHLKSKTFRDQVVLSKTVSKDIAIDKATGKKLAFKTKPSKRYAKIGTSTLVNGLRGSNSYGDGSWIGFREDDLIAVIDLEKPVDLSKLTIGTLCDQGSWIFPPKEINVYVSDDGKNFKFVKSQKGIDASIKQPKRIIDQEILFEANSRYVKIEVKRFGNMPSWHNSAGEPSHLFVDRISLD